MIPCLKRRTNKIQGGAPTLATVALARGQVAGLGALLLVGLPFLPQTREESGRFLASGHTAHRLEAGSAQHVCEHWHLLIACAQQGCGWLRDGRGRMTEAQHTIVINVFYL